MNCKIHKRGLRASQSQPEPTRHIFAFHSFYFPGHVIGLVYPALRNSCRIQKNVGERGPFVASRRSWCGLYLCPLTAPQHDHHRAADMMTLALTRKRARAAHKRQPSRPTLVNHAKALCCICGGNMNRYEPYSNLDIYGIFIYIFPTHSHTLHHTIKQPSSASPSPSSWPQNFFKN